MSEAPRPWPECVDLHPDVLSDDFSEDVFALDLGAFSQASAAGTKPLDSRFRGNDGLKKTVHLSFARNQDHVRRHSPVITAKPASTAGTKPLDSRFRGNDGLKKTIRLSFVRNQDHVRRHSPVIPAEAGIQKSRSIIRHFAQPLMDKRLLPDRERITACRQTLKRCSRRIEKRLTMRAR